MRQTHPLLAWPCLALCHVTATRQTKHVDDKRTVLAVDVGGSHVKVLTSDETERRRAPSGPTLTASEMVAAALEAAGDWKWDVVAVGIPAPVHGGRVATEPFNLGKGWVGFDYEAAFGVPTKVMNDAAM